ncbi:MAG: SRPBCC family protein [Acidimicrobiia bacterium]
MHIHLCTTIGAPVDAVWRTVEDIGSHPRWMTDAESITFLTDQRAGVGTEFDCATRVGPFTTVDRMHVTEWEPGRVMGIEHRGLVTGRGRFTLRSLDAAITEFCWTEDLTFPTRMGGGVGERIGRPVFERIWRANLRRLRALAEA